MQRHLVSGISNLDRKGIILGNVLNYNKVSKLLMYLTLIFVDCWYEDKRVLVYI